MRSFLKRLLAVFLILFTLTLYAPNIILAGEQSPPVKPGITEQEPQIRSTPQEQIPTVKKKKTSGWTWLILLGVVGGAAIAAGAGGGGESSSGGGGDTGSYNGSW